MFRNLMWGRKVVSVVQVPQDTPQEVQVPVLPEDNPKTIKPLMKDETPTS